MIRGFLRAGNPVVNFDADAGGGVLAQVLPPTLLERMTAVCGDSTDGHRFARVVSEQKISRIIHLAPLQIPASNAKPPLAVSVNEGGLVNVFETVRLLGLASGVRLASLPSSGRRRRLPNVFSTSAVTKPHSTPGSTSGLMAAWD